MIGALGACFGRVVTMDSPKAREPGTFSLAGDAVARAGARHHAADVEAARAALADRRDSVYEEGKARPEWGRDMEVPFAMRAGRGKVAQAEGSRTPASPRPDTIALAYYQASLLVDHIVATHGAGRAADAARVLRRGPRRGRGADEGARRLDGRAAGQLRQGARDAVRVAASRAADAAGDGRRRRARGRASTR